MSRREDFIRILEQMCDDDSHGYDQNNRWGPDFDCSSLMYWCAHEAGYDVPIYSGYTGTMVRDFTNAGWTCVPYTNQNLWDIPGGCIMLQATRHTEGVIRDGQWGGAHCNEWGGIVGGAVGDQSGREISRCNPYHYAPYPDDWDYILYPPDEEEDMPSAQEIAEAVWAKVIKGHEAGERLYLDNVQLFDRTDYSGRGMDGVTPIERLSWMAAKQEAMQEQLANISEQVAKIAKAIEGK